ncbi:MAG: HAMP domain-containing histidine kinase [Actinomycetota bacterium]|nr:HAMP domain-containing histidine kinase [Actinomycetota bacterium]
MSRLVLVLAAAVGVAVTVAVALAQPLSRTEAAELALIAGAGAVAIGLAGAGVLYLLRNGSIGAQAVVVAATSLAAVTGGAVAASKAMFVTGSDLGALWVVLAASATVGIVTALVLGRRVDRASRSLEAAAQRIGSGELPANVPSPPTGELAALAAQLDAMATRLEEARTRERALESSRRELVSWVSHDLRTPLAGIRAVTEALEDGVVSDPETVARYHRTLREEADTLTVLVEDLFQLSRIQAGALRLSLERSSIGDLVSDAVAATEPMARRAGIRLEGRLEEPIPELVLSMPEISRVIRNLLENAIRHSRPGGTVRVEAGTGPGHVFVSVTDTCGGIPLDEIDRVFETGFRGATARTPGHDGAGLGLAIARGLVEAHRGRIGVANQNGGCRFTFHLPVPS